MNIIQKVEDDIDYKKFDEYVYRTFECFINHKIYIDMHGMDRNFVNDGMRDLVMHSLEKVYLDKTRSSGDMTNLFRKVMIEIFKPKKITVNFQTGEKEKVYIISLWPLLSIIINFKIRSTSRFG